MKCVICKQGNTRQGKTTVTLERGRVTLVFRAVQAEVCPNCGEAYVDEKVSAQLLAEAEEAARSGVQVEIREFLPAPAS